MWPLLAVDPFGSRNRGLTYGTLVGTEPPAPTFFRRDDAALDQTLCSIREKRFVLQGRIRVAAIINLQQRLPIHELPSQPDEVVDPQLSRLRASSISGV